MDGYELPSECWEVTLGPLQGQQVLLTNEPSPHPPLMFKYSNSHVAAFWFFLLTRFPCSNSVGNYLQNTCAVPNTILCARNTYSNFLLSCTSYSSGRQEWLIWINYGRNGKHYKSHEVKPRVNAGDFGRPGGYLSHRQHVSSSPKGVRKRAQRIWRKMPRRPSQGRWWGTPRRPPRQEGNNQGQKDGWQWGRGSVPHPIIKDLAS